MDYRNERLIKVCKATVNREIACFNRMLNLVVKSDKYLIRNNPIKDLKPYDEDPAEDRQLTTEEYYKLLDSAPEYFKRIIFFAANTGCRKMEILNLKWGNITRGIDGFNAELVFTKPGKKDYIPINDEVVGMIEEIAKERGIDLYNLKEDDRKKYIFTSLRGQRLQSFRKPKHATFVKAGISERDFHTFRHFWTKMMFVAGVDPSTIMKVGRWKDLKTMLKYCYTSTNEQHEAVNKLADKLSRKTGKVLDMRQYSGKNSS